MTSLLSYHLPFSCTPPSPYHILSCLLSPLVTILSPYHIPSLFLITGLLIPLLTPSLHSPPCTLCYLPSPFSPHSTNFFTLFTFSPLHYHLSYLPPHSTNILTIQHITGRSFDAMGPKTTVENAKAPADWVTLKGVKEPVKKDEEAPVSIAERRRRRRTGGN
jgi:hypothetical protein